jgi:hypothetical protein
LIAGPLSCAIDGLSFRRAYTNSSRNTDFRTLPGASSAGGLGVGDNDARFPNLGEMGDSLPLVDLPR